MLAFDVAFSSKCNCPHCTCFLAFCSALLAFSVEASEPQRTRLINSEGVSSQPQGSRPSAEDVNCSHIQHEPYSLLPTGRYVHTAQYLRDALAGAEWCVSVLTKDTLRYNGGQPVVGHLCVAVRS